MGAALLGAGRGLVGALLVHAASVTDGVDGEVARLQLRGRPRGALLDGVLDRVADAAILAGLGLWALDGHHARIVLALTVAGTAGALLSMATKDRAAALGLPSAPERALGWLLGGRDGRLLLGGRGRAAGRARRGPGGGDGHLGAVAEPAGRLPAPSAGRLTAPAPLASVARWLIANADSRDSESHPTLRLGREVSRTRTGAAARPTRARSLPGCRLGVAPV
ncbi:MAG TPA: CDP-alcohol phosphatidyltransferase family protein, partial [Actinomycetes bacterium]|nr:CDP-alcohol phosphatidyltransferase family protein [Actinomycetes bacterium]